MEKEKLAIIIRDKFAKIPFFARVFIENNKIIIWNDYKIKIELDDKLINELIKTDNDIDTFINTAYKAMIQKIEKKYAEMKNRRVSVVIPNYNNEMFLKKTISSILDNSYRFIEVIFVDDCSTDSSVEVVKKNFGDNPRVKIYVNKENRGAYYCRNKGILLSSGYYVTVVDGDDFIDKNKLEYEVNNLERLNGMKENDEDKFWAYGTRFQRIYFKNNDMDNITHINKSNSFVFLFTRRLFNYLGFFQNNRFGADTEYFKRARMLGYKFYQDKKQYLYNAYTIAGKNLTQVHKAEERRKYIDQCTVVIRNKGYIEMALLDEIDHFKEIIYSVMGKDKKDKE